MTLKRKSLNSMAEERDCPITYAVHLIAKKWTLQIIYLLYQSKEPIRFLELQRKVGRVTQKELTKRLRELEVNGLVSRKVYAEVPLKVEYQLTTVAKEAYPYLEGLLSWAEKHGAKFLKRRASTAKAISESN